MVSAQFSLFLISHSNFMESERIKSITEEFLASMGFEVSVEILPQNEIMEIIVVSQEADKLIGVGGKTLEDVRYILGALFRAQLQERFFFTLDVNGYLRRKEEFLRELARVMAERVRRSKKALTLKPMPARERRLIHLELAGFPDIMTESIGSEPERRLMVRPYP